MTPTTNLANAARRLLADHRDGGFDTVEHELSVALDEFDAQEILNIDIRSRLSDAAFLEILEEEVHQDMRSAFDDAEVRKPTLHIRQPAALAAMRRIANYADHLRGLILLLGANADLSGLIYTVRDQEQQGWDGPKVKAAGEAIAGMLAEIQANPPARPVDNSPAAVDETPRLA